MARLSGGWLWCAMLACGSTLAVVSPAPAREACPAGWSQPMPSRRLIGCVMAYDSANQRMLLVGGTSDRTSRELWSWDGSGWEVLTRDGPSIMTFGAAYHEGSKQLIVFGGGVPTALLPNQETWSWDGVQWVQHTFGVPPAARFDAGMAPDPASGGILLFGGYGMVGLQLGPLGDTWLWDGIEWSQVIGAGPPARIDHGMCTDTGRGRVVVFGGQTTGGGLLADTWEWDGGQWLQRAVVGPSARKQHRMAYDAARGVTVLAGGIDGQGQLLNETWEWDGSSWVQRSVPGLSGVRLHCMAYDPGRQRIVLNAGSMATVTTANDILLEYDGSAWTTIQHEPPPPRAHAAMAFDAARSEAVLFGGAGVGGPDARTWVWDGEDWRVASASGPTARQRSAMTWDSARNVTLMFGGLTHNGRNATADTWTWNGTAWSLASSPGPQARGEHVLTFDESRGVVVLFGGVNADGTVLLGDTWEWDGSSWTQRVVTGPSARRSAHAVYDASRQKVVLLGGIAAGGAMSDAWTWDGTQWTPLTLSGGPPGTLTSLAYDRDLGGIVAVDANPGNQLARAWSLVGDQWRLCAQSGPLPPLGVMAYDTARRESLYVTGTATIAEVTETWRLAVAVAGDCNGDRAVNGSDLAVLLAQFGQAIAPGTAADINGDGMVNGADLSTLLSNFGASCPVSG